MTVRDNIRQGKYNHTMEYPTSDKYPDKEERTAKLREFRSQDNEKLEEFKKDLEAEYGTEGHPKADKLYEIAWRYGHAYGLNEVDNFYSEFVELIK